MKKKVIIAGHICLDITPVFPDIKVRKLTDILSPGKLLQVGEVDVHTGGAVANTGLGMKILGADVTLMAKMGKDSFGSMVTGILQGYGADCRMIVSEEESTSYSVVLAVPGIDRIFLHNPGANNHFYAEDVPEELLRQAALFHFGYPSLMRSMYLEEGRELCRLLQRVQAAGAATSLDFAAVDAGSEAGRTDWNAVLEKALPYVDFFVPSVEELCFMLDRTRYEEWQSRAAGGDITEILDVERDIKPLADRCLELGAKVLLLKCGVLGMYYRSAHAGAIETISPRLELDVTAWAEKEGFEPSYEPERVLSGTGAGDTSIAAFLAAMLEGKDMKRSVQLAAATGACCVTAYDALSGLQPFEVLEQRIDAGWKKRKG